MGSIRDVCDSVGKLGNRFLFFGPIGSSPLLFFLLLTRCEIVSNETSNYCAVAVTIPWIAIPCVTVSWTVITPDQHLPSGMSLVAASNIVAVTSR